MGTPLPPHIHAVPTTQIPVKVGPVGVMKVYGGSGGIAPRMLTLDTKMEVSGQVHPSVFFCPLGTRVRFQFDGRLSPTASIEVLEAKNSLPMPGDGNLGRSSRYGDRLRLG